MEYYDRLSSLKNLQEILKKHETELLGSDWEQGKLSFNQITENKVEAESYTKEFEQSVKIELENVSKSSTTNTDNFYHLGQFAGKDYYGSLKLSEKIDKITAKRLENALKKGFANHAFGNNGVKFIEHNHQTEGFELKIKGDTRAYSNKVYKYQEKAFIQFDKLGNHTDVEKFFSNHHIETAVLSNDDLIKLCGVNYENQFIE